MSTAVAVSSVAAEFRALPAGVPPSALKHLGITSAHILALEVLGITLLDAVAHGFIKLPAPLTVEAFPAYLNTVKEWVEMGLDPNEPHDEAGMVPLEQAKAEGLLPELE